VADLINLLRIVMPLIAVSSNIAAILPSLAGLSQFAVLVIAKDPFHPSAPSITGQNIHESVYFRKSDLRESACHIAFSVRGGYASRLYVMKNLYTAAIVRKIFSSLEKG
jgi:hypothetical protein